MRRETVEHPFGTLKMRMGATHFLMKRLPKVATEMASARARLQLTRVMNIMGVEPLIAAMRGVTRRCSRDLVIAPRDRLGCLSQARDMFLPPRAKNMRHTPHVAARRAIHYRRTPCQSVITQPRPKAD